MTLPGESENKDDWGSTLIAILKILLGKTGVSDWVGDFDQFAACQIGLVVPWWLPTNLDLERASRALPDYIIAKPHSEFCKRGSVFEKL